MNETIKAKVDLKWSSFPVLFFIGAVVLLLVVYGKVYLHIRYHDISTAVFKILTIDVWSAGSITVQQGIAEFTGQPMPTVKLGKYLSMFGSFLLLFVINPVLFILTRKKIYNNKLEQKKSSLIVRFCNYVSLAILIIIPAITISTVITTNSLFSQFKEMNIETKYREDVKRELSTIIFKAQQYFILPVEEGGGGKSFLKNGTPLSLKDLGFEERTSLGRTILYQQKSDTIIHLLFIGNRKGTINTSYNPDIIHVVEFEGTIFPSRYKLDLNY